MPWNNQAVSLIILTEEASGFSGIFGYSPTVGAGNLIFSVSAAAGTDPYGNSYPAGVYSAAGYWAGKISGSQIVPGTVPAAALVAGIIVAGIVNGTTLEGVTLIASGGGALAAKMTDDALEFDGIGAESVTFLSAMAAASKSGRPQATLSGPADNDGVAQLLLVGESEDGTASPTLILQGYTLSGGVSQPVAVQLNGWVVATEPGSVSTAAPSGIPETWHAMPLPTPSSGTFSSSSYIRYKLLSATMMAVQFELSGATMDLNFNLGTLPAGYIPKTDYKMAAGIYETSTGADIFRFGCSTAGLMALLGSGATINEADGYYEIPLD